jgi:hypothetical protein
MSAVLVQYVTIVHELAFYSSQHGVWAFETRVGDAACLVYIMSISRHLWITPTAYGFKTTRLVSLPRGKESPVSVRPENLRTFIIYG